MALKRNTAVYVLLLLLFLLGAVYISFSYFLPRYIENSILPEIGSRLSVSLNGRVFNIGLSAADFGSIVLGSSENPAVSIGSIHAEYSLSSLPAKKLGRVTINGLTLHAKIDNGKITLPGVELEKIINAESGEKPAQEPNSLDLPFAPSDFRINNGLVIVGFGKERFLLPFDLQLREKATGSTRPVYDLTLEMMPQGEKVSLTGTIDLADNKSIFTLVADSLNLDRYAFLAGATKSNFALGRASARGEAEINLLPLQLVSALLDITPDLFYFGKTAIRFGHIGSVSGPGVKLEIKSNQDRQQVIMQGSISEPIGVFLEASGSVVAEKNTVQGSGNIVVEISEPKAMGKNEYPVISLRNTSKLHGDFSLSLAEAGTWQAEFNSPGPKQQDGHSQTFQLRYDDINLQAEIPSLFVQGRGTNNNGELRVTFAVPQVSAEYDGAKIAMAEANLQATYKQGEDSAQGRTSKVTLGLKLDNIKLQKNGLTTKADISLQGEIKAAIIPCG